VSTPQPPGPPGPPSTPTPPGPAPPPKSPASQEDKPSTWQPMLYLKIGLLLVVIAWAIGFVVENGQHVRVHFVVFSEDVRLIWMILLLLGLGLLGGVLISQLYRHRRRSQLAKKARKPGDTGGAVGRRDKAEGKPR
jgi:uncharacterized membrane protein YciS (DUF1049 family)